MSRVLMLSIPLASACAYAPDSFSGPQASFPGARATVGCLDVSIAVTDAHHRDPVVRYTVGNRCDHTTIIDLSAIRVQPADGRLGDHVLLPFDPQQEMRPLPIEARSVISEQIEYRYASTSDPRPLCFEIADINGDKALEQWLWEGSTRGQNPSNATAYRGGVR